MEQSAEMRTLSGKGLPVRDPLTGLYTDAYWEHALNRRRRLMFRRPMPVTCLAIRVGGSAGPTVSARWLNC